MQNDRLTKIVSLLEKTGSVEVRQLSEELNVTEKTIRQDLTRLEQEGILKRVHGGAIQNLNYSLEAYSDSMRIRCLRSKESIALAAFEYARQISPEVSVFFLDAGTTTYEFSRLLRNLNYSTVLTNDLMIAENLYSMNGALHLTGGSLFYKVNRYLIGPDAINMINNHWMSICFLGASSISIERGFMTYTNEDAQIKQAAISRSETAICLADHTKFSKNSFVRFADFKDIDILITDADTPAEQVRAIEEQGTKVILAPRNSSTD